MFSLRTSYVFALPFVLAIGASAASADAITSSLSISSTATTFKAYSTPFTLAVPQFNSALGTLTDVSIQITLPTVNEIVSISPGTSFAIVNGNFVQTYNYNAPYSETLSQASIGLYTPDATSFPSVTTGYTPVNSATLPVPTTPYTGTTPATNIAVQIDNFLVSLAGAYDVPAANLSALIGSGTLPIGFAVNTGLTQASGSGGNLNTGVGSYSGNAVVTYTYTTVPEPASLSLVGASMMLVLRRRRAN